jgi:tRNA pseudouridine13 synthase
MQPYFTAEVPGCGGAFRQSPEDFVVEELPAYQPLGEGDCEHLFLWVEKRGRSTPEVAQALAKHLGVKERDVSWAGLKDRQAITRQFLCVPAKAEARLAGFELTGVQVLWSKRHRNKLKVGHLAGNHFTLQVRGVTDAGAAEATLARLAQGGLPNYFGEQRFGHSGQNAARGKAILLAGGRHRDRFERKLFLSAYQSELFNRVLARRLTAGTFTSALQGDVLKKHQTGGEFVCAEPAVDQPRVEAFEVSATGPIYGPTMRAAEGAVGEAEAAVLAEEGLTLQTFEAGGDETAGTRRFFRTPLTQLEHALEGDVLTLRFVLPAGSYATALLRELLKQG